MATVHLFLQGKGGIGKSLVASLIAQHRQHHGYNLINIDTDPINATLAAYPELGAQHLNLLKDNSIDPRQFDHLVEIVLSSPPESEIVIDTGGGSFMQMCSYLLENQVLELLSEESHEIVVHCILTGGQAMADTLAGLKSLVEHFHGPARIIVWANEYFGDLETVRDAQAISVLDLQSFRKFESRIDGIITISRRSHLFAEDMKELLQRHQTFAAARNDANLTVMTRHRLQMIWNNMSEQMDLVLGAPI